MADILAVSYFEALRFRPDDPKWEDRDRFFLSIGHYAIALYAALIEAGVLDEADIETYGTDDSRLPMNGIASLTPGMEVTGGSLGQGLTIAVGMCLGLRRKGSKSFVYNLRSDGEINEGATWEALLSAELQQHFLNGLEHDFCNAISAGRRAPLFRIVSISFSASGKGRRLMRPIFSATTTYPG